MVKAPPTFSFVARREPLVGPSFTAAPDSQFQNLLPQVQSYQEAPDPIRQSDYWNYNNKINPWPHQRITSHLAIGVKESVMQDRFEIGKLIGYIHAGQRNQYAGGQLSSDLRTNIRPPVSATFGSMYQSSGLTNTARLITAKGFALTPEDFSGYPF